MYIDLSVTLNAQTPVYPGDPDIKIEAVGILKRDGYTDHYVSLATHIATHIDAPLHMLAGGKTLDEFEIEKFAGRGCYIKVEDDSFNLEAVKQAGVQANDIVLFDTGWSAKYYQTGYFEDYPTIPDDIAHYLVEKKVKMVGMDMCSPDHEPFPVHKILLRGNVLIIENLTNLYRLAGKNFMVYALPIKLQLDGAPARVIAQLE